MNNNEERNQNSSLSYPSVFVEEGSFQMGSSQDAQFDDEKPQHKVDVNSFWMMSHPVTFQLYDAFCSDSGRTLPSDQGWGRGEQPVINVSWYDALRFSNWLSQRDSLEPVYGGIDSAKGRAPDKKSPTWDREAQGWRLPTEAEWEYACKGGQISQGYIFPGSNDPDKTTWSRENSASQAHPVALKMPNELGLYDLSGNVAEWCWDWHGAYPKTDQENPIGAPHGEVRILRGGSWANGAAYCTPTIRYFRNPYHSSNCYGFRVVRNSDGK